ncbi:DNA polymerase I [Tessaracoccus bendigoensis DSM 12906]|uniref:DNA polymerase I n=1 Tax=Tessaracoccus bendigoensis DSM 12906 TaxID=1123357 RepID=A0A1M6MKE6_9ACTN|nr:DNA polymerase I [Tessaracoccus bendigoensis]SHJ83932.1 DNA polymerase I [Tessaracoccus bendigoensis DSM 12906]
MDIPGKLLLIDGHSVAYRAFFALPVDNFSTSTGQHTNAVFGFTSMLINVLREERPTHLAVAFDVARESFRTEQYPEYKATRAKSPDEFKGQVQLIKQVLDSLNIAHVEKPGYEADDIIATLSTQAAADGFDVFIVTGDRDAMQLVNERVTVLYPRKGVSDLARMTPDAVTEKYLVAPVRYPELAALVGETSDNLPGVPGVGPKTAAKWLTQFDGLENLIARAEQAPGKAGESFRAHLDDVVRNRRLNALVRDLDIDLTVEATVRRDWDRELVHTLFDALEFRVLRERLLELAPAEPVKTGGFEVAGARLVAGELPAWLDAHAVEATAVDFVGTWGSGTGDITGIAFATSDGAGAYVDTAELSVADDQALAKWLTDPSHPKIVHGAKGAMLGCWARGWELSGVELDTLLAAYLLRPDQRTYDLADLALRYLHRDLSAAAMVTDDDGQGAFSFDDEPDEVADSALLRARAVFDLSGAIADELEERGAVSLLREVELPLQGQLAGMERVGICVDVDRLERLRDDFDRAVVGAQQAAWDVLGHEVNLGSPKQLQGVLFDELDMPKTRRTKSGYTTDAEALESLFARTAHPFLEHLLEHRDAIRLRQTVDGLLAAVASDGRVHTTYVQTIAATGRLSSTDPNLQNIPIRTSLGRQIRSAFVPGDGFESLMSADYSQIEMRIMAHASGDEGLIEAFASGRDFHGEMASLVFGVEPEDVTGEMRARIKAMNYGLAYGLSAFGLSNQLKISVGEAKALMEDYFARVGGVHDYLAGIVEQARKVGYTETMLGRRRYLPDLTSSNRQRREMAERAALNSPIQGSAADVIKVAMINVGAALEREGLHSRVLLQVHDELVFEVAPGEQDRLGALVETEMGGAMALKVPLSVSVGVGPNWESAAH